METPTHHCKDVLFFCLYTVGKEKKVRKDGLAPSKKTEDHLSWQKRGTTKSFLSKKGYNEKLSKQRKGTTKSFLSKERYNKNFDDGDVMMVVLFFCGGGVSDSQIAGVVGTKWRVSLL